jgi:hypothetical protein
MASEITFTVGEHAKFVGYAQVEKGFQPILADGQTVEITGIEDNGNIIAVAVDDNGVRLATDRTPFEEGKQPMADQVWVSELAKLEVSENTETAETTEEPAPATEASEIVPVEDMSKPKLTEVLEANGFGKPKGWSKMRIDDARAEVKALLALDAVDKEEAVEETQPDALATAETATDNTTSDVAETQDEATDTTSTVVNEQSEITRDMTLANTDTEAVRDLLAVHTPIAAALLLFKQSQRTDFTLGGILKRISDTGAHKGLGYVDKKGFEDFCHEHIGIAYRKARYLIDIYAKFTQIGFDEKRLEAIGWSKAKELARIEADQLAANIDALLEYASANTRDDLITHIKAQYEVSSRAETVQTTTFRFKLVADTAELVKEALDQAQANAEVNNPDEALAYICGEWIGHSAGSDLSLDDLVQLALAKFDKEELVAAIENGEADEVPAMEEHDATSDNA